MRRFYRFTSRSLPARRPGRIPEMASNHWVTASVLIVAAAVACLTPGLMSSGADDDVADGLADPSRVEAALPPSREQAAGNVVVAGAVAPLFMPDGRAEPCRWICAGRRAGGRLGDSAGPPASAAERGN